MEEEGTRYTTTVRGSECVIEQNENGKFDLRINGQHKESFLSATAAREHLVLVIREQAPVADAVARSQVPLLSSWGIERTAPFDPEGR